MTDEKELTPIDRQRAGENIMHDYSFNQEGGIWGDLYDKPEVVLVDLLADLMHYAHLHDPQIPFDQAFQTAVGHFNAECEP